MFHLTELVTFSIIKGKNSPASLKYSQWIFLVMANYEKICFSFQDKLDIYVLVMTASRGKKKGAAQVMMKKKEQQKNSFFSSTFFRILPLLSSFF